jgi:hemoglobin
MLDPDKPSLYQRLGGHDVVSAFVEDLMPRLTGDPTLAVYWKGKSRDSMRKDKQLLLEFLCMAFGGPSAYLGRDMKTSHEGLGITDDERDVFAVLEFPMCTRQLSGWLAACGRLAELLETRTMPDRHGVSRKPANRPAAEVV